MRPIYITMTAIACLSLSAPASAQWHNERTSKQLPSALAPAQWSHDRTYSDQLEAQIDGGVSQGTISRHESIALREDLSRLVRLERRFSPDGISGREHAVLFERSNALSKEIRAASGSDARGNNHAVTWQSGDVNGHWVPDARFAGLHPGDRFDGDVRIGQHATARMVNLPTEYRGQYVDDARVYYGYDNGRVYQIDRQSQMILALLDIARN